METSRVTSKGQTTIPRRIREAAHIHTGDLLSFRVDNQGRVIVELIDVPADDELAAVEETLGEWSGPEDERAWSHL